LIKYILEEATPDESNQVQQWLATNAANQARFEKLQQVWQLASQPNEQLVIDTPSALQRLKQTVHARETVSIKRIWTRLWPAAAVVLGIVGLALGAYVWMTPKTAVKKEQPPVVKPDTAQQRPVRSDTVPALQPVPGLHTDTMSVVKPHKKKRAVPAAPVQPMSSKKKRSIPVTPVQPVPRKKKMAQSPTELRDTIPVKRKHAIPAQPAQPVRKHKTAPAPKAPEAPVKEPPIS
jgi:anti-sigma factor RsiW